MKIIPNCTDIGMGHSNENCKKNRFHFPTFRLNFVKFNTNSVVNILQDTFRHLLNI